MEALLYCAILIILAGSLLTVLTNVSRPLRRISITRNLTQSAQVILERLSYDIRRAESIDDANSLLATSSGKLTLKSRDASDNLVSTAFTVATTTNRLQLTEPNGTPLPLSPAGIIVNSLVFRKIVTTNSDAIKMELIISDSRLVSATTSFYSTKVLRNNY